MKNKFLALVVVMCMALTMIPGVALAAEHTVTDVSGIKDAINNDTDGDIVIILGNNVTIGEKLTVPASKNVTIKGAYTITRDAAYTGTLFEVAAGATLTLDGGLVIDGNNNWGFNETQYDADLENMTQICTDKTDKTNGETVKNRYFTPEVGKPVASAFMITTKGGTVNLNDVTIKNNFSMSSGIVSAGENSTITLTGAKITHCAAVQGNGVAVNASGAGIKVTMNEDTIIDGNFVGGNHGIFKIYSGTVFTMNDGSIKNTKGWNSNGTAIGIYHATVIMNGGEICSNSSVYGPANGRNAAVYVHSTSTFTMNGGSICHNGGRARGGLDAPYADDEEEGASVSEVEISGGYIGDNISFAGNTNKDVNGGNKLTITGGTFTQDVSQWLGDGVKPPVKGSDGKYYVGDDMKNAPVAPAPAPKPSGSGIKVEYEGGNSFSTSKSAVPTSVEIDGVAVPFTGNGSSFTVNSIPAGAKWVTVRWNSTSVTTNFTPSGAYAAEIEIPKTGDASLWAAVAAVLGF